MSDWTEVLLLPKDARALAELGELIGRDLSDTLAYVTNIARDLVLLSEEHVEREEEWVRFEAVFETDAIPIGAARVIREAALRQATNRHHLWQPLEWWAAEALAAP
jgi:hypothetical protein